MKISRVGSSAVLGRRLARELNPDELNLVGGGGENTKTNIFGDKANEPICKFEENTLPGGFSDVKCTL